MNLAEEKDVSGRLAGHQVVEAVVEEQDGFSDVGKSWQKGSSAMFEGTTVQITQCPFLQPTSSRPQEYVWHADHRADARL